MKQLVTILFSWLAIISFAAEKQTTDFAIKDSIIDQLIQKQLEEFNIPGAIVTVIKEGKVIHINGYGVTNIKEGTPINPQKSKFRVASITKTFTALAILDFVDQGKLDLHEDIRTYLPEEEFRFKASESFTLHHVLCHTSGIEYSDVRIHPDALEDQEIETFAKTSVPNQVYQPGTIFSYSNQAYSFLGYLIEKLSGMRYEEYMDQFIKDRLGMMHSTFFMHSDEKPLSDVVDPYAWENETFQIMPRQYTLNPAASNLNTTGFDMANFMMMMMNDGSFNEAQVLNETMHKQMLTSQFIPKLKKESMGYGVMIDQTNKGKVISHNGGIRGFVSTFQIVPEKKSGIFISQSTRYGNEGFAFMAAEEIWNYILGEREPLQFPEVTAEELKDFAKEYDGTYQLYTVNQSTYEAGAKLFGLSERTVKYLGEDMIQVDHRSYKAIDKNIFEVVDEDRDWQVGFDHIEQSGHTILNMGLYATYRKISWYETILALQIAAYTSGTILLMSLFVMARNWWRRKAQNIISENSFADRWIGITSLLLLLGFGIMGICFALEVEIDTGTPFPYKLGLAMTSLGVLSSFLSPIAMYKIWSQKSNSFSTSIFFTLAVIAVIVLSVCYYDMNLFGMNYYFK